MPTLRRPEHGDLKLRISHKLFIALALIAASGLVLMGALMQHRLGQGFLHYINQLDATRVESLAVALEAVHAREGSFEKLTRRREAWRALTRETIGQRGARPHRSGPPDRPPPPGGERRARPPPQVPSLSRRVVLLDPDKHYLAGPRRAARAGALNLRELTGDGERIGWVGWQPLERVSAPSDVGFLRQQASELYGIAAIVLLLTSVVALLLARHFVRPINSLAAAAERLAAGEFDTRVLHKGTDEIATLGRDFNVLAQSLAQSESARRRWVADISHELRTPLAVLRAEIEALEDGVRTPGKEVLHSLHTEVLSLGRIVDDLYQLSLSDIGSLSYSFEPLELNELLERVVALFDGRCRGRGLAIELHKESASTKVNADQKRLLQLFSNVIENSLRYTTEGGKIDIRVTCSQRRCVVNVDDSPPGILNGEYDKLFERFYRVDAARSREHGGSGLGLAICKSIVDAHGGHISASPSPLGGMRIAIELEEIK